MYACNYVNFLAEWLKLVIVASLSRYADTMSKRGVLPLWQLDTWEILITIQAPKSRASQAGPWDPDR